MTTARRPASPEELATVGAVIDRWADEQLRTPESGVVAVDFERDQRRWFVRLAGEDKAFITVWLTLWERTLRHETYFMPAPEENVEACFEYLLRANARLNGVRFAIGPEDAVYLMGEVPVAGVDDDALDAITGAAWAYSEQYFRSAMQIGFASRFRPRRP